MDKQSQRIICTAFTNGKRHDFRLFKESKVKILPQIQATADTGYQGLKKLHANSVLPKKKTKKAPLSSQEKQENRQIASQRVLNEHAIGRVKRFKIIADRYRK